MFDVHHVIAGVEVGQEALSRRGPSGHCTRRSPPAEQLGVAEDDDLGGRQIDAEAAGEGAMVEIDGCFQSVIGRPESLYRDITLEGQLSYSLGLLGYDDDGGLPPPGRLVEVVQ